MLSYNQVLSFIGFLSATNLVILSQQTPKVSLTWFVFYSSSSSVLSTHGLDNLIFMAVLFQIGVGQFL